jgi:hypothetical protein
MENEKKRTLKIQNAVDFCRACYLYDLASDEASNSDSSVSAADIIADMDLRSEREEVKEILFKLCAECFVHVKTTDRC